MPRLKHTFGHGFYVALRGIGFTFLTQRNMRIHVFMAIVSSGLGFYFSISRLEWMYLCASIFLVFVAETLNTALECAIDLVTRKTKYRAMMSKDIAAGAVLLACVHALIAGLIIFYPKLALFFSGGR